MTLLYLLLAYALCFGIQNKLPFLYSSDYRETGVATRPTDRLLHCTYCTGFHCGWVAWLIAWWVEGKLPDAIVSGWAVPASILIWTFTSAAFCYIADALVRWLEANTG